VKHFALLRGPNDNRLARYLANREQAKRHNLKRRRAQGDDIPVGALLYIESGHSCAGLRATLLIPAVLKVKTTSAAVCALTFAKTRKQNCKVPLEPL